MKNLILAAGALALVAYFFAGGFIPAFLVFTGIIVGKFVR